MTPAELWAAYQPKFDEAKKRDNEEQTLVFIIQPVKLGSFWIAPLTLRRLLFLEALDSPLAGGHQKSVGRRAVLELLWVMSPDFSPSRWRAKLFFVRHWLLNWKKYAIMIEALMKEGMELLGALSNEEKQDTVNPLWVAQTIDGFATQYGWSMAEILDMPLLQLNIMGRAMAKRLSMMSGKKNGEVSFNRNADAVRTEYLKESRKKAGLRHG
tara:strand:+ start:114 stop:749 length:636 start_codon:yes stop_codon:yes gene_type:complete